MFGLCLLPQGSVNGGPELQRISRLVLGSVEGAPIIWSSVSRVSDIGTYSGSHVSLIYQQHFKMHSSCASTYCPYRSNYNGNYN